MMRFLISRAVDHPISLFDGLKKSGIASNTLGVSHLESDSAKRTEWVFFNVAAYGDYPLLPAGEGLGRRAGDEGTQFRPHLQRYFCMMIKNQPDEQTPW